MRVLLLCSLIPGMLFLSPCKALSQQAAQPLNDAYGDPLPEGAVSRIGTIKYRVADFHSARLSPDANLLAVPHKWAGHIELWDVPGWSKCRVIAIPPAEKAKANELADIDALRFSPDGKMLAAFDERHHRLLFFDLTAAKCIGSFPAPDDVRLHVEVVMAPVGHEFVALMYRTSGQWCCFLGDVANGAFEQIWERSGQYLAVAISPDCRWTGIASDEDLSLVNLESGKIAWQVKIDYTSTSYQSKTAAFSGDGKRIVVASSASLRIHDAATGKELCNQRRHSDSAGGLIHAPDGKSFYLCERDVITAWDAHAAKKTATYPLPAQGDVRQIAFTGDGKVLGLAQTQYGYGYNSLHLWDVMTGKTLSPTDALDWRVSDIAFSADGKLRVNFAWWNPRSGARLTKTQPKPATPFDALGQYRWPGDWAVLHQQGALAASLQHDKVRIWETDTGRETEQFRVPLDAGEVATLLAIADAGRHFAISTFKIAPPADDKIKQVDAKKPARFFVWDREKNAVIDTWKNDCRALAVLSADGRRLAYADLHGKVRVREVAPEKGKKDDHIIELGGTATCLAFSPDGSQLACATEQGDQRKVCLCESTTAKITRIVHADRFSDIYYLTYSPDGSLLAGNARDTTALVWETGLHGAAAAPVAVAVPQMELNAKSIPQLASTVPFDDPLPQGALRRLGTLRYRLPESVDAATVQLSPTASHLAGLDNEGSIVTWKLPAWSDGPTFRPAQSAEAKAPGFQSFAFTADGSLTAVDSAHRVAIFNVATGKCIRLVGLPADFRPDWASLAVSPDRRILVCTSTTEKYTHQTLVWDLENDKLRHAIRLPYLTYTTLLHYSPVGRGGIPIHAISANCRWLAIGNLAGKQNTDANNAIDLWDCTTGKLAQRIDCGARLTHMLFSPDGNRLAVQLDEEPTIRIYEAANGKEIHNLRLFDGWSQTFAFAPGGKKLWVAESGYHDRDLRSWDLATGLATAAFTMPGAGQAQQLAFSPKGDPVALAVADRMVRCWEPVSGQFHSPLDVWRHPISVLQFKERDELFVGTQGCNVSWWNARTGVKLRDVKLEGLERAWSKDRIEMVVAGDTLACFDGCRQQYPAKAWLSDLSTGKLLCYDETDSFPTLSLYANGRKAASLQSNVVRIWDTATGRDQSRLDARTQEDMASRTSMLASENGRLFAFGTEGGGLVLWDNVKRAVLGSWQLDATWPRAAPVEKAICFSSDNRWLAFPETPNTLRLVRPNVASAGTTLALGDQETLTCLVFSPTGRELACAVRGESHGLASTRIVIYELPSMKARAEFVGHGSATITCLAYSSDGMLLASGSDDATVLIWHYEKNSTEVKKQKE